ncbi:hypothetical protein ACFE04_030005 [Oxalis oulophora]
MAYNLFSLALLFSFIATISCDEALINKVCTHEYVRIDYCFLCFNTNPNTTQQDIYGLSGTSISCARRQANDLSVLFQKHNFIICHQQFQIVAQSIEAAYESWKRKDYDSVMELITEADKSYLTCSRELEGVHVPKKVSAGMSRMDNFILNAGAIVHTMLMK